MTQFLPKLTLTEWCCLFSGAKKQKSKQQQQKNKQFSVVKGEKRRKKNKARERVLFYYLGNHCIVIVSAEKNVKTHFLSQAEGESQEWTKRHRNVLMKKFCPSSWKIKKKEMYFLFLQIWHAQVFHRNPRYFSLLSEACRLKTYFDRDLSTEAIFFHFFFF